MQRSLHPYEYQHIIAQLDQFDASLDDNTFHNAWMYAKMMVHAHGEVIRTLSDVQDDCSALAWSQLSPHSMMMITNLYWPLLES